MNIREFRIRFRIMTYATIAAIPENEDEFTYNFGSLLPKYDALASLCFEAIRKKLPPSKSVLKDLQRLFFRTKNILKKPKNKFASEYKYRKLKKSLNAFAACLCFFDNF